MNLVLSLLAALGATAFGVDLGRDAIRRPRPHVVAYAVGIAMFALASWAFFFGVAFGWSPFSYKIFFLFGAVLNVPFLALGSVHLVIGERTGRAVTGLLVGFSLIAILQILPASLNPLGDEVIPETAEAFMVGGPRLLAILAGAIGGTLLLVLALVSAFRFWRSNRRIFLGNLFIAAGTLAAASGGSVLALTGQSGFFALTLAMASFLIWAGYRIASGSRSSSVTERSDPTTLVT